MATLLVYTIAPYVPFTKILSASINQDKTDIKNRLNWAGGSSTTTGLSGDNIQSNTALTEVPASGTIGGVTYTAVSGQGAGGNSITIAYTAGAVAGSEVVTVVGSAISVQVSSGVSTVTQVRTAVNASLYAAALVTATGTSSSTVSTTSPTALTSGVDGSGITRSTKLSLGLASGVVVNDSSGKMSAVSQISTSQGGTGLNINFANQTSGDVLQVNAGLTGFTVGAPTAVPASLRIFQYNNLS